MKDNDHELQKRIAGSYSDLIFGKQSREAVLARIAGDQLGNRSRFERVSLGLAAVAALTIGVNTALLLATPASTAPPEYVVTNLPAAALEYTGGTE